MATGSLPTSAQPPTETGTPTQGTMSELVSGILTDAQTLIKQQVVMLRSEFKEDMQRTKEAAKYMGFGAGLAALGGLFLVISLVYLLKYLFPALAEVACWAIVGGVLLVAGLIAVYAGKKIFDKFNPLPDKTATALQENLTWLTNRQS